MPKEYLATGLSGLVGSRLPQLFPKDNFIDLSLDTGYDILKPQGLEEAFKNSKADTIFNFAAFTDTNASWLQRGDKTALCYQLNVVGAQNIINLCQKYQKNLVHISTDFVFDGTKDTAYTEKDTPNPIEWYGQTKYEAEKLVESSGLNYKIVRIAYPYRAHYPKKVDFVRKIIQKFKDREQLHLFSDQITTTTFVDDIALGLIKLSDLPQSGLYHLVGSSSQSPYELALAIAAEFNFKSELIQETSLETYISTQASDCRPWQKKLIISNQKFINDTGLTPKTLKEGLSLLRTQMNL